MSYRLLILLALILAAGEIGSGSERLSSAPLRPTSGKATWSGTLSGPTTVEINYRKNTAKPCCLEGKFPDGSHIVSILSDNAVGGEEMDVSRGGILEIRGVKPINKDLPVILTLTWEAP